jgi:hypothetical protein
MRDRGSGGGAIVSVVIGSALAITLAACGLGPPGGTQAGSLTVEVQTPGDDGAFPFVTSIAGSTSFTVVTSDGSGRHGPVDVAAGAHIVEFLAPVGWLLIFARCDNGGDPAAVTIGSGEAVTCSFVVHRDPDIVIVTGVDFTAPFTLPGGSVRWDTGETCFDCRPPTFDFNVWGIPARFWWIRSDTEAGGVTLDGSTYAVLGPGSTIGPGAEFITPIEEAATVQWRDESGVQGYLGFRFHNRGTGAVNYGFALLSASGEGGHAVTIHGWAYDRVGRPITIPDEF